MKLPLLPSDFRTLRNVIKTSIEEYQGSPVKNENKLNECVAHALSYPNYDTLSAVIAKGDDCIGLSDERSYYVIKRHKKRYYICQRGVEDRLGIRVIIEQVVNRLDMGYMVADLHKQRMTEALGNVSMQSMDECIVKQIQSLGYVISNREDRMDDLFEWISESTSPDKEVMIEDLKFLQSIDDQYIFESVNAPNFVTASRHPEKFDNICEDLLALTAHRQRIFNFAHFPIVLTDNAGYELTFMSYAGESQDTKSGLVLGRKKVTHIPVGGDAKYAGSDFTVKAKIGPVELTGDQWRFLEDDGLKDFLHSLYVSEDEAREGLDYLMMVNR